MVNWFCRGDDGGLLWPGWLYVYYDADDDDNMVGHMFMFIMMLIADADNQGAWLVICLSL